MLASSGGNTNWSNPDNWLDDQGQKRAPNEADTVIFSGGFSTSDVDAAFTVAALEVTSGWSFGLCHVDAPLTVTGDLNFDCPSGSFGGDGPMTIGGSGSRWSAGELIIGAGGLTNNGTLTIDTGTTTGLTMAGTGTAANNMLTNNGTITETGSSVLFLQLGGPVPMTVINNGEYDFSGDCSIVGGSNQRNDVMINANTGVVEKTSGTGVSLLAADGFTSQAGGAVEVTSGTLTLSNLSCSLESPTFEVQGSGSMLHFSHPVTAKGTFTGSGSGTILLDNPMVVDGQGVTFKMTGSKLFQWSGSTMDVSSGGTATNAAGSTLNLSGTVLHGSGSLVNNGTMNAPGNLTIDTGATLVNNALYDFTGDAGIAGGGTLNNSSTGMLEKTGGNGTSFIGLTFNNTGGTMNVQTGILTLNNVGVSPVGLINGATLNVASGASLNLAAGKVRYQGAITGVGLGTIAAGLATGGGTIQIATGGASFNMQAPNLFQWRDGHTIDVSLGNLTNATTSTLNLGQCSLSGAGTLTNLGTINESGSNGELDLQNGATVVNKKTFNIKSDASIEGGSSGTFVNTGMLRKAAGTGVSLVGCTLNNTGTLEVSSGTVHVGGAVTQIAGGTLGAGKWIVSVVGSTKGTIIIDALFTAIGAHAAVTLSGAGAVFANLSNNLASILANGSLLLEGNASLITSGSLANGGKLTMDAGSILSVGSTFGHSTFSQTSTATLTVQIKATSTATSAGTIVIPANGGGLTLGGQLALTVSGTPALGVPLTILNDLSSSPVAGVFANLAEGGVLTVGGHQYQIHYGSATVTLTRIS
jgi:hypothetical protein